EGVRVDVPVVVVEAVVGVERPAQERDVLAIAREERELVAEIRARVGLRRAGADDEGALVGVVQEAVVDLVLERALDRRVAAQHLREAHEERALLLLLLRVAAEVLGVRRLDAVPGEARAAGERRVLLVEGALAAESAADREVVVLDRDAAVER